MLAASIVTLASHWH